jgi:hypothetical protein
MVCYPVHLVEFTCGNIYSYGLTNISRENAYISAGIYQRKVFNPLFIVSGG